MRLNHFTQKALDVFNHWQKVADQRRELRNLSDHMLKDLGLSRVDADREASRPFWQVQPNSDRTLRHRGDPQNRATPVSCGLGPCNQN